MTAIVPGWWSLTVQNDPEEVKWKYDALGKWLIEYENKFGILELLNITPEEHIVELASLPVERNSPDFLHLPNKVGEKKSLCEFRWE